MIDRKTTLHLFFSFAGAPSLLSASDAAAERLPNVLIVIVDDAGYADFGFMGSKEIPTPELDRLAADGRVFTDAHVAATVSSPSRAMLLTGRQGQRYGYECNTGSRSHGLPITETILPAVLKEKGYRTACIGKWHLGEQSHQHPNAKGFDQFYGLIGGSRNYFYDNKGADRNGSPQQYQHNGKPRQFEGYFTDELTNRAVDFIDEQSKEGQPFMMYLSYTAPHTPIQATPEDLKLFEGHPRQKYAAMMHAMDRGVGKVVEQLKQSGAYDNTLIFFLSDNGGATNNGSVNLPYKGFKGNKFEGGHRVPFFVVWGDRFANPNPFTGLTSSLDIMATVLDAVGINERKLANEIDGTSLLPFLEGKKHGNPHDELFWRKMDSHALRMSNYKLIMTENIDTVLYDLSDMENEVRDLSQSDPKLLKRMIRIYDKWQRDICTPPLWIEEGWATRTNELHRKLMHNEIRSAQDLYKKK